MTARPHCQKPQACEALSADRHCNTCHMRRMRHDPEVARNREAAMQAEQARRTARSEQRIADVVAMTAEGLDLPTISAALKLSKGTVCKMRRIARQRAELPTSATPTGGMARVWSADEDAALADLWAAGLPVPQIKRAMRDRFAISDHTVSRRLHTLTINEVIKPRPREDAPAPEPEAAPQQRPRPSLAPVPSLARPLPVIVSRRTGEVIA
ncbi:hypothetical protein [Methylobrevis pamukkalensis]|uniref:Uncharacterized protein n=1 Tax=Methylobrevis pamukkalensis TaxID=1439726 RepID=A0A1E3GYS7_9HYPH|nr:hypothetical protein [Methylobrevis pamukkalensis]ODN69210.1 hypothetical protein A6302_03472 [Methylobrevis pamukkalensis]